MDWGRFAAVPTGLQLGRVYWDGFFVLGTNFLSKCGELSKVGK